MRNWISSSGRRPSAVATPPASLVVNPGTDPPGANLAGAGASMHIVVDTGSDNCANMGDVAMLQVAVERIRRAWPEAVIYVPTDAPAALALFCPGVVPMAASAKRLWFQTHTIFDRPHHLLPARVDRALARTKRAVRRFRPKLLRTLVRMRQGESTGTLDRFLEVVAGAQVIIACGQGGITDHVSTQAISLLDLLDMAMRSNAWVAMLGQGIGPMTGSRLRAIARDVLPRVPFIALRESRTGPALLAELGVPAEHITVTGDDAIALAHALRPSGPGGAIGVNLRVAPSAGVDESVIPAVRSVVHDCARRFGAQLLPVPIALGQRALDAHTIQRLLAGFDDASDGGRTLDSPRAIIEQVGRCRVVVTGAYHAAVFALAQGIPAVCVARSTYFADKLLGLADQFGTGCEVVLIAEDGFEPRLRDAIDRAWHHADEYRTPLLEAATRQITLGEEAFAQLRVRIDTSIATQQRGRSPTK